MEFGFAVSGIDFRDFGGLHWLLQILYVANVPTKKSTIESIIRLKALDKEADETATAALEDNAPERKFFFILFDFFQRAYEQQLAEEEKRLETNDNVTHISTVKSAETVSSLPTQCPTDARLKHNLNTTNKTSCSTIQLVCTGEKMSCNVNVR